MGPGIKINRIHNKLRFYDNWKGVQILSIVFLLLKMKIDEKKIKNENHVDKLIF